MSLDSATFSRLTAKRKEQTPQALARLSILGAFIGLWALLALAGMPMPTPFLLLLIAEAIVMLVYWVTVFRLPSIHAIELAHYGMLAAEIIFHTTMVYFLGGITWLGAFAYVFGLIFTNAYLDLRRGFVYTAGASLAFVSLILLESSGTIPHQVYLDETSGRHQDFEFVATTIIGGAGVFFSIYLWVNWVGSQLRRERDAAVLTQDALLAARSELQSANEELEERVHKRTKEVQFAAAALRESEGQMRLVFETCPDLIAIHEPAGRYRFVNSAFESVLGYRPVELVGQSPADLIHPDDLELPMEGFREMVLSRQPGEATFRIRHASGHWVTLETNGNVLLDRDGAVTGVVVVGRDVTERMKAEDALRENEARTRLIIDTALDAVITIDQAGTVTGWNAQAEAIFGWKPREIIGARLAETVTPARHRNGLRRYLESAGQAMSQGRALSVAKHRDGHEFPVEISVAPFRWGESAGFSAFVRDITDRVAADEATRTSEATLKATLESTADGILVVDASGAVAYANARFAEMWRIPAEVLETNDDDKLLDFVLEQLDDAEGFLAKVKQLYQTMEEDLDEITFKDGRSFERYSRPLLRDGQIGGRVWSFRDITERRRQEDALREQARRDPLTGVLNHAAAMDELRALTTSINNGSHCTIAMVDVDGLKAVNDTYGHQLGDQVLIAVAQALSIDGALVGRYGGDEFVALLPHCDRERGELYRSRFLDRLSTTDLRDAETGAFVPAVASMGLAVYPEEADTIIELITLSDSAMYASRRQRIIRPGGLSRGRALGNDRAAEMVGQMVPLLTSLGSLNDKLRLVAHRLSVGAGYDGVDVSLFAPTPGEPLGQNTFAQVPQELVDQWSEESRVSTDDPHPIRILFERTRRPVIIDMPWESDLLLENQRELLKAADLPSVLVAPLLWGDEVIGTLGVASKRRRAFDAGDAQFLATVATQVTAIIHMASLVEELQTSSTKLQGAQTETVLLLAAAAEAHDHTTGAHLQSLRSLSEALALALDKSADAAHELGLAASLHDIGKIRVPNSVLGSSGLLSEAEWEVMRRHTTWGADFLSGRLGFELAATIARSHHERWDGNGYPDGLMGEDIPEAARIVTVADAFDAMISDRPYRKGRSIEAAVDELTACSGTQFAPDVVEALKRLHGRGELPGLCNRRTHLAA
jgi:diguanylate cyclase (GGDEF)-like protein/PAS domain S-box-containing protein